MPARTKFKLYGGHPALDFVNTLAWRLGETPEERLDSYADLLAWARTVALVDPGERRALEAAGRREPQKAERTLHKAIEVRELGYRLMEPLLVGGAPRAPDLERLNRLVKDSSRGASLEWSGDGYAWSRVRARDATADVLVPIVRALVELLTSPESGRVARCQDDRGCGWLFLDHSRSRARRWCSMADCGNRAKARRHYRRTSS